MFGPPAPSGAVCRHIPASCPRRLVCLFSETSQSQDNLIVLVWRKTGQAAGARLSQLLWNDDVPSERQQQVRKRFWYHDSWVRVGNDAPSAYF